MSTDEIKPASEPMYCPSCDTMVPENWDRYDERFRCQECRSTLYEDKETYIQVCHATARWNKNNGYGPWWDETDNGGESDGDGR